METHIEFFVSISRRHQVDTKDRDSFRIDFTPKRNQHEIPGQLRVDVASRRNRHEPADQSSRRCRVGAKSIQKTAQFSRRLRLDTTSIRNSRTTFASISRQHQVHRKSKPLFRIKLESNPQAIQTIGECTYDLDRDRFYSLSLAI